MKCIAIFAMLACILHIEAAGYSKNRLFQLARCKFSGHSAQECKNFIFKRRSRFSTEKKSGAHFRVNGEIRKLVPELNTCKCDPYTGRCEKINYCIQFGYLLKGYSALHVRASAKSICKFKGGRYRTKDYSGKIIRLSASKSWGWRDVKINFLVECAEKQSFHIETGRYFGREIQLRDISISVGKC